MDNVRNTGRPKGKEYVGERGDEVSKTHPVVQQPLGREAFNVRWAVLQSRVVPAACCTHHFATRKGLLRFSFLVRNSSRTGSTLDEGSIPEARL
ncbi:hypothetical protein PUN28_015565 [Cardiocondyla obscurior]|uniref:Uncharacterized protein n=1 Tax=Cardiocondyla obscurior TaxID=286306 RepID=A0AAW2EZR5_9HYME